MLRRGVVLLAVPAVVLSLLAGVPASADGPRQHKQKVDRRTQQVHSDLVESTKAVAAAVRTLQRAQARLQPARAALTRAAKQAGAARAADERAAAHLEAARLRERRATRELAGVHRRIRTNKDLMGQIARAAYVRGGSLGELSLVMQSQSVAELRDRMMAVDTVLESQQAAAHQLDVDRARLAGRKATLEAVRAEVAKLREEAAARLAARKATEARARAAKRRVSRLVHRRRDAVVRARGARAADQRQYRRLQAESRKLEKELAARARRAGAGAGTAPSGVSGNLLAPVSGPITSPYGMRVHPITGVYKLHDGTDFGVGCGTPVHAAAAGTVVHASALTGYGNQVALDHGVVKRAGLATSYNHLSRFAVSAGQHVRRGQVVGYVGTTGYSTGCHLHFMVYVNGATVNPRGWL